jgi:hypothetical protein
MPISRITPLAPAYLLLLGAVIILIVGPVLAPRRRYWLAVVVSALAVLCLFLVGSGYPADVELVRVLVKWLGKPALALRVPPFEPFLWVMMLSLLAISVAARGVIERLPVLDQAMLLALAAAACGVVLAGNYRTLAFTLFLFDATAALFALVGRRPDQAVARLLLGVLSSAVVVALAQGTDHLTAHPLALGGFFSLTLWLRLGLYPLVEAEAPVGFLPPLRLGWGVINLAVGLYLVLAGVVPWVAWLAGVTMLLHGLLAWLEPSRERALAHASQALAGGILLMAAVVNNTSGVVAASMSILAAWVALGLTAPRLSRPDASHPWRLWAYLAPLLATVSLVGVPFTLGWEGRGVLYQLTWEAGAPGALTLIIVAEGAALSVLYRYWRRLLPGTPAVMEPSPGSGEIPATSFQKKEGREQGEREVWRWLGASLAAIPLLIPLVGPRWLLSAAPSASVSTAVGSQPLSALLGLTGSLLWALFLGYGRRRLLDAMPFSRDALARALRLGWLLVGLGRALDTLARVLLRIRAVIEGEHYLAWAILLALGLGLMVAFNPGLIR